MSGYDITLSVHDETRVLIESSNVFRDKELILTLPGARYNTREHKFLAPLTWATCVAMRGIFGDRLLIQEDLANWAWTERNERIDPAIVLREAWGIDDNDSELSAIVKSWRP